MIWVSKTASDQDLVEASWKLLMDSNYNFLHPGICKSYLWLYLHVNFVQFSNLIFLDVFVSSRWVCMSLFNSVLPKMFTWHGSVDIWWGRHCSMFFEEPWQLPGTTSQRWWYHKSKMMITASSCFTLTCMQVFLSLRLANLPMPICIMNIRTLNHFVMLQYFTVYDVYASISDRKFTKQSKRRT